MDCINVTLSDLKKTSTHGRIGRVREGPLDGDLFPVDPYRICDGGDTLINLVHILLSESKTSKGSEKEGLIHRVEGFLKVDFKYVP